MTKPKTGKTNQGGKGIPSEFRAPNLKPTYDAWAWQEQGNCISVDTDVFFLPYNARYTEKQELEARAKAVCVGCPVINDCLNHAVSVPEHYGVWGGLTPEERKVIIRRNKLNNKLNIKTTTDTTKD